MPTYKDIRTLARALVGQVTESGESWKAFLDSAAYTYNYAFPNQLLIFSQRPDATAVASIDYWNNKVMQAEDVEQNHGRNRTYHFVYRDL